MAAKDEIAKAQELVKRELGGSVVSIGERPTDEQLREVASWDDAVALYNQQNPDRPVESASDLIGNGYTLYRGDDAKARLIGVPMFLQHWNINRGGDFGDFVSVIGITKTGQKFIINDGSTGIAQQVAKLDRERGAGGVIVESGLRSSTYSTCGKCDLPLGADEPVCENCDYSGPERHKGTTFYLDLSAS